MHLISFPVWLISDGYRFYKCYFMISFINRILLGQSRDGIVFSTDDYFHHQDGYRYNVNQLGDAHDWNQNRGLFWAKSPGIEYLTRSQRTWVILLNLNYTSWLTLTSHLNNFETDSLLSSIRCSNIIHTRLPDQGGCENQRI